MGSPDSCPKDRGVCRAAGAARNANLLEGLEIEFMPVRENARQLANQRLFQERRVRRGRRTALTLPLFPPPQKDPIATVGLEPRRNCQTS
jgi:hypothetical protein